MKQFASWFTHGVPRGSILRKAVYEAKQRETILAAVEQFFDALLNGSLPQADIEVPSPDDDLVSNPAAMSG